MNNDPAGAFILVAMVILAIAIVIALVAALVIGGWLL